MLTFFPTLALSALTFTGALAGPLSTRNNDPYTCNRRCLTTIATQYMDGLGLRNISGIPFSQSVRYTDQGVVTPPGQGTIWKIAGGVAVPWRMALYDTTTGSIMFNGLVTNFTTFPPYYATAANSTSYAYTLRLKVEYSEITEVEEVYQPGASLFGNFTGGLSDLTQWTEPDRTYESLIPLEEQSTRAELFDLATNYWGVINSSYPALGPKSIFGPECQRLEDFVLTTNGQIVPQSCGVSFPAWNASDIRIYITDPARGVVAGLVKLDRGPSRQIIGKTRSYWHSVCLGNAKVSFVSLVPTVGEWFKVKDNKLSHIEAFFNTKGQNSSNWEHAVPARPSN